MQTVDSSEVEQDIVLDIVGIDIRNFWILLQVLFPLVEKGTYNLCFLSRKACHINAIHTTVEFLGALRGGEASINSAPAKSA